MPQFQKYTNLSQKFGGNRVLAFENCINEEQEHRLSRIVMKKVITLKRCIKVATEQNTSLSTFGQLNILNWRSPDCIQLRSIMTHCLDRYLYEFSTEYQGHQPPRYSYGWANVVEKNLINQRPHFHHSNPLNISAILYATGEYKKNNGETKFWINDNKKASLTPKSFLPKPGMLLIYQATIPHNISYYSSDLPRITFAFDIQNDPGSGKLGFIQL